MEPAATSDYDASAEAYAAYVAWRERGGVAGDPLGILGPLLELLGDVAGQTVLDAGCGEGYLARVLAARGARVTGLDLAPSLIARARERTPDGSIAYELADLSEPLPAHEGRFDAVASYLVLNDVDEYRGFAATLARSLRPGGRMVLALNNPYGAVVRGHVQDSSRPGPSAPTERCGPPACACTTATGRSSSTSTRSSARDWCWRSWPTCRAPTMAQRCRRATASPGSCSSSSPRAGDDPPAAGEAAPLHLGPRPRAATRTTTGIASTGAPAGRGAS